MSLLRQFQLEQRFIHEIYQVTFFLVLGNFAMRFFAVRFYIVGNFALRVFCSTELSPHGIFAVRIFRRTNFSPSGNLAVRPLHRVDFSLYGFFAVQYLVYIFSQTNLDVGSNHVRHHSCNFRRNRSYCNVKKLFKIKQMLELNSRSKPFVNT